MKDYLIWAAEEMENKYGMDFDFWQEWIMSGGYIPPSCSIDSYLEAR